MVGTTSEVIGEMKWLLRTCAPMFHDCLYYFIRAQMKVVAVVSETELKRFPAPVQYTICPRLLTHRFWTFLIGCCVRVPHHIFICGLRVTRHPVGLRRRGYTHTSGARLTGLIPEVPAQPLDLILLILLVFDSNARGGGSPLYAVASATQRRGSEKRPMQTTR